MTDPISNTPRKFGCVYWLLTVLTSIVAIIGIGTVIRAVTLPPELTAQTSLIMPLELIAGALWAGIFALVTGMLIRRKRRAVSKALWALLAFTVYSTARLLILARADYDVGRLPFLLVTLAFILISAGLVRAAAQWRHQYDVERED